MLDFFTPIAHRLHSEIQNGIPQALVKELGEQIYAVPFFSGAFCKELVDAFRRETAWIAERDMASHSPFHLLDDRAEPTKAPSTFNVRKQYLLQHFAVEAEDGEFNIQPVLPLCHFSEINCWLTDTYARLLLPLFRTLWPPFHGVLSEQPYIVRYQAQHRKGMRVHADHETIALIIYLNDDFEGGGTIFPRWNLNLGKQLPGTAVIYPGGISHLHGGTDITSGERYLLRTGFF